MSGSGMAPRTIARIRGIVAGFPEGKRFTSGDIAHELNISAREVGATLRWQENVRKIGKIKSDRGIEWERI